MPARARHCTILSLCLVLLTACGLPAPRLMPGVIATPTFPATASQTASATLPPEPTLTPTALPPTLTPAATPSFSLDGIIPKPVLVVPAEGTFYLTPGMMIYLQPATGEVASIGQYLADRLNPASGYGVRVAAADGTPPPGSISLSLAGTDAALGEEGYQLTITSDLVSVQANQPAGLFHGVQTLRQLLPASIEAEQPQPGPWVLPAGTITDYPRFAWRGAMLDVVRHFFTVAEVERYIDLLALYKINHLHLHLTDDQGWRIEIKSWPDLTSIGAGTQVGGGPGGFYTQEEYAAMVAYAQSRYITIVPEIDMPGHVTAALAAYPSLNCDGVAPQIYTNIHVSYSSLCFSNDSPYRFMQAVLDEVARLTPGPYIHIGGDEAGATSMGDYIDFMQRAQAVIEAEDKHTIGWEEIAQAKLMPGSVVQHWNLGDGAIGQTLQQGNRLIMSPTDKTYMNIKYDSTTPIGWDYGLFLDVQTAYSWDPLTIGPGVNEKEILGVEAPLWTEQLASMADLEYMTYPRLPGYAEIGWTPQVERNWEDYRLRLAGQGPRWTVLGVNFFRSAEIPWK